MILLVTGASGHVGANLVRALLDEGRHVCRDKAEQELGYRTRPLPESIRDAYAWFAAAGLVRLPAAG